MKAALVDDQVGGRGHQSIMTTRMHGSPVKAKSHFKKNRVNKTLTEDKFLKHLMQHQCTSWFQYLAYVAVFRHPASDERSCIRILVELIILHKSPDKKSLFKAPEELERTKWTRWEWT